MEGRKTALDIGLHVLKPGRHFGVKEKKNILCEITSMLFLSHHHFNAKVESLFSCMLCTKTTNHCRLQLSLLFCVGNAD